MANFGKGRNATTSRYCYDKNNLTDGKFVGVFDVETKQLVDKREGYDRAVVFSNAKNVPVSHGNGWKSHKLGDNYWFSKA